MLAFLICDCFWTEAASWRGGSEPLWARLLLGDVQFSCLPWANAGLHSLRFGPRCSSDGIFQALLCPFIQQLFLFLWFLALCQQRHLPQLYNGCEPHRSPKVLLTVFPTDSCEVSDQGWGPAIIKGPHCNNPLRFSNIPVDFKGPRFAPGEPSNVAVVIWGLTLSSDQVPTAFHSASGKKS